MDIFFALCIIPLGFLLLWKTKEVVDFTGEIEFAEKYMPSGGTYTFIKLCGLLAMFLAFAYVIGGFDMFLPKNMENMV